MPRSRFGGRHSRLRPVKPKDYAFLYDLSVESALRGTWQFYSAPPSPEEFDRTLWADVLAQFIVENAKGDPVGLAVCYGADFRSGYGYIGFILSEPGRLSVWPLEAGGLFVDYLFETFRFRKLYGEGPNLAFDQITASFGAYFAEEGRLCKHVLVHGGYRDWITIAIYADQLADIRATQDQRRTLLAAEFQGGDDAQRASLDTA